MESRAKSEQFRTADGPEFQADSVLYESYREQLNSLFHSRKNFHIPDAADRLIELARNYHRVVEWACTDPVLRELYTYDKQEAKLVRQGVENPTSQYVVLRDGDRVLNELVEQNLVFLRRDPEQEDAAFNVYLRTMYDNLEAVEAILRNKVADQVGELPESNIINKPEMEATPAGSGFHARSNGRESRTDEDAETSASGIKPWEDTINK